MNSIHASNSVFAADAVTADVILSQGTKNHFFGIIVIIFIPII